jgi:hypothetical protein
VSRRVQAILTIHPNCKANPGPQLLRWVRAVNHHKKRKIVLTPDTSTLRTWKEPGRQTSRFEEPGKG